MLLRKFLLVLIKGLLQHDANTQVLCTGALLGAALLAQVLMRPYIDDRVNRMEVQLLLVLCSQLGLGWISSTTVDSGESALDAAREQLGTKVVVLFFIVLVCAILSIATTMRSLSKRVAKVKRELHAAKAALASETGAADKMERGVSKLGKGKGKDLTSKKVVL